MAGQETEQFPLRMTKGTHKALKVLCAQEGLTMNGVINEAIEQWMKKRQEEKANEFLEKETKATQESLAKQRQDEETSKKAHERAKTHPEEEAKLDAEFRAKLAKKASPKKKAS